MGLGPRLWRLALAAQSLPDTSQHWGNLRWWRALFCQWWAVTPPVHQSAKPSPPGVAIQQLIAQTPQRLKTTEAFFKVREMWHIILGTTSRMLLFIRCVQMGRCWKGKWTGFPRISDASDRRGPNAKLQPLIDEFSASIRRQAGVCCHSHCCGSISCFLAHTAWSICRCQAAVLINRSVLAAAAAAQTLRQRQRLHRLHRLRWAFSSQRGTIPLRPRPVQTYLLPPRTEKTSNRLQQD